MTTDPGDYCAAGSSGLGDYTAAYIGSDDGNGGGGGGDGNGGGDGGNGGGGGGGGGGNRVTMDVTTAIFLCVVATALIFHDIWRNWDDLRKQNRNDSCNESNIMSLQLHFPFEWRFHIYTTLFY